MPLTPRFSWEQDASSLALSVLLPGGALKSADIYVSDLVVKINSSPYVLLLDLFALVDDASAAVKTVASESLLRITLQKVEAQQWPTLECKDSKIALRARRDESMARRTASDAALTEQRKERKYQEEKQTLRAQMAVDDTNRQILHDLKAEEKQREERALYESFRALKEQEQQRAQTAAHEQREQQQQRTAATTALRSPLHAKPVKMSAAPTAAKTLTAAVEKTSSALRSPTKSRKPKKRVTFASDVASTQAQRSSPSRAADTAREEEPMVLELGADGSFDLPTTTAPASAEPKRTDTSELRVTSNSKSTSTSVHTLAQVKDTEQDPEAPQSDADEALETPSLSPPSLPAPAPAPAVIPVAVRAIPPPRQALQSEIQFTPRVFPTPSRESKAAEEEDWLVKNRQHLSRHKGLRNAGAYDISESDPTWLKAKGDDFYRARDYQSAVNAYTEALALAPEQSDLAITCLSNRAAAHLQLLAFETCIADCSTALSYIPDTRASSDSSSGVLVHYRLKLKLVVRRGSAYCRVGKYTEAKADYGVALSMDNQNATLQDDFVQLVALEKAQELKLAGDACFRDQDLDRAVTHYSDSLRLDPRSIACLSNRATCYLLQRALAKCVDDCTLALELLQQHDAVPSEDHAAESSLAFFSAGPAPGSVKRRAWVLKTLVRRGTAFAAMREWTKAEVDYAASVELDPTSEALQADLNHVRAEIAKRAASPDTLTTEPSSLKAKDSGECVASERAKVASAC